MPKDDRIQPTAANIPAVPQTAVKTGPVAPAPTKTAPTAPNPVATRFLEMWDKLKPSLNTRLLYILLAIVLVIGGYFLIDHLFFDKKPDSERWVKWFTLDDPTQVRTVAESIRVEEGSKAKTNPGLPDMDDSPYESYKIYSRLLDEFAQSVPDTNQARLAHLQKGRFLMILAMREVGYSISLGRSRAAEILQTVADDYEKLEPQFASDPILQEEVILTQAKARETLGEVDKAIELYKKLAESDKSKNGAAGKEAAACLQRLSDPRNKQEAVELAQKFVPRASK